MTRLGPFDRLGFGHTNRLPMHALRRAAEVDLDGEWDFQLRSSVDESAAPDWSVVQVPGLWTMSEEQDRPHYTNVPMPFEDAFPTPPAANPVGVYRRSVTVAKRAGRRTVLHVGSAEGYLRVSVGGVPVGTSGDSHLAAEFDITDFLAEGPTEIELAVTKWSAQSYLEDQDHWWQFGLARSVFLYSVPDVRLADVTVVADFDPTSSSGSLRVTVETEGLRHLAEVTHTLRVQVLGVEHSLEIAPRMPSPTLPRPSKDRSVRPAFVAPDDFMDLISLNAAAAALPAEFRALPDGGRGAFGHSGLPAGSAVLQLDDLDVPAWSAENPHLEGLLVELLDSSGAVVDAAALRVGFRRVEIVGRELLINGEAVLFQGVSRHDVDPRTGRVMTRDRLLAELSLLKRNNVNAVRTAHYPNDPMFLDLCDEVGMYVVDEANVEGHAFASTIAHAPIYLGEMVDRVARMVLRDRNHASIVTWSLGNETGYGAPHDAAAAWVRSVDPTRPVQYEGAITTDWYGGSNATDIVAPMYASYGALEAYSADPRGDRPLILCEYAYSQGNSTGGFADYWRLFESLPGLQGGFIWQFTDHALDPDGDGRYRYGGDFGDEPNSGATLLNGVAFADLTPQPALFEIRGVFSPIRIVSDADDAVRGRLRLASRRYFTGLDDLALELRVQTREGTALTATIPTPVIAPQREATVELPDEVVAALRHPSALALSIVLRTAADSLWAPAGTEIAEHQVVLPRTVPALPGTIRPARVDTAGDVVHPLIALAPRLCLWRALTDNDRSFTVGQRFLHSGFFALTAAETNVENDGAATLVTIRYRAEFGDEILHRRRIAETADGTLVFDEEVVLPADTRDGLRVGVEMHLTAGFEQASWTGLGPWENYPDRCSSALLGRWHLPVDEFIVPYVRPQESGTRGGVTALDLDGPAGSVGIATDIPVHVSVGRHTVAQLEDADHLWELPPSDATIVHIDVAHRGVGTGLLGPDTPPLHRLSGSRWTWRWSLAADTADIAIENGATA